MGGRVGARVRVSSQGWGKGEGGGGGAAWEDRLPTEHYYYYYYYYHYHYYHHHYWLPGKTGWPQSISPMMQPTLHMSTPRW